MGTTERTIVLPSTGSDATQKSFIERALSLIWEVKPGEGSAALLLCLNLMVLLCAYYLLKTVRESLILTEGSAEVKAYSSAAQALVLLAVIPLYGWIARFLNRVRLMRWTTLFFAFNLVLFYLAGQSGIRVGVLFYIWIGIFNVFSVAQLWSFASDLFTCEQGKRLFPLLGVGASIGAVIGAWIAGRIFGKVGPYSIMLIGAAALCVCALLSKLAGAVVGRWSAEEKRKDTETLSAIGGFELLSKDRYLMLLAVLTVVLNIVSLSGDFILGKLLVNHANEVVGAAKSLTNARKTYIGEFYASYYTWTNVISFVVQTFLVSRLFRWIGIGGSLFVLPLISLATFSSILVVPVLSVVRALKIVENGTNYSLQNTVRHALLLPTSRDAKYKAKAAIDTFFWRFGDVLQAVIIFLGTRLHFTVRSFAAVSLTVTLIWGWVALRLNQRHNVLYQQKAQQEALLNSQPMAARS